jgi:hypothetical protein
VIKKICYIYIIEYYSAIRKNEIMLFAGRWTELEINILSKISQTQKDKACFLLWNQDRKKDMKIEGELFGKMKRTSRGGEDKRE